MKSEFIYVLIFFRFMECILHIAYRIDFATHMRNTPEKKALSAQRQTEIQNAFKSEMGLLLDIPKTGSGTSNDGNTARRFFEDPKKTTRLLQLDRPQLKGKAEKLIERFSIILKTLNSGFLIDVDAFQLFCSETAQLYCHKELFKWYPMPPAVHRVLIHGAEIIRAAKVPIGVLSEEPQESRNKDIKNYREMRARKCSR